jgi:hypothetical protein
MGFSDPGMWLLCCSDRVMRHALAQITPSHLRIGSASKAATQTRI